MPYKYIGRTTSHVGKSLWEILGNLKNFGVGRLIVRSKNERYPEKSFFKVLQVTALANPKQPSSDDSRKVRVLVERTFRGVKSARPETLESVTYKVDYKLVPKHEEHQFLNVAVPVKQEILPRFTEYPPLLHAHLLRETKCKPEDLKLEIYYNKRMQLAVAKDGETPTRVYTDQLDMSYAPELYKHVKL